MANYDQYGFSKDKTKYDLTQIENLIDTKIANEKTKILSNAWPVGSIMILAVTTTPNQLGLPGTWQKIGGDYFLCSAKDNTELGRTNAGTGPIKLAASDIPPHAHRLIYTTDMTDYQRPNDTVTGAAWARCRLIKNGTGCIKNNKWEPSTAIEVSFKIRRAHGNKTPIFEPFNDNTLLKYTGKSTNPIEYGNLLESSAATTDDKNTYHSDRPDTIEGNITTSAKIDGWTSDGIYNKTAYDNGVALSQTSRDFKPKFYGVNIYRRTA